MANEFDAYREALVIEQSTIWPDAFDGWDATEKRPVEDRLHADPRSAAELQYVRQHTGFCRQITVTDADLQRLGVAIQ